MAGDLSKSIFLHLVNQTCALSSLSVHHSWHYKQSKVIELLLTVSSNNPLSRDFLRSNRNSRFFVNRSGKLGKIMRNPLFYSLLRS